MAEPDRGQEQKNRPEAESGGWPGIQARERRPMLRFWRGVVAYLQECGFTNLTIGRILGGDNTRMPSWQPATNGFPDSMACRLRTCRPIPGKSCDGGRHGYPDLRYRGTDGILMINLPVLKGHCQTLITCALKNNKGLIPNAEKRRFHTLGAASSHRPSEHRGPKRFYPCG